MGWGAEELAEQGRGRQHPEWVAAAEFWKTYQQVISGFRFSSFDSSELLSMAVGAVASPEVMSNVELIVIDDAQEITAGAIRLLHAFAQRSVPIIAAGDPDITSTGFRGAVPQFLGRCAVELGLEPASVSHFVLPVVYRHGPTVRSVVKKMTEIGTAASGSQRQAVSAIDDYSTHSVVVLERGSRTAETTALALQLREKHILGSTRWSDMVVVVRTGALVPQIARALAVAEVPTRTLLSERSLKEHPAALDLIAALAVAMGRLELTPAVVNDLLTSPMVGLTALELRRVRLALRHEELAHGGVRTGEELLIGALSQPHDLLTLDFGPARRVAAFAQTLALLREGIAAGDSIEELLWTVWDRSGLAKIWGAEAVSSGLVADDANRNLDGVMALFTSAKRFVERHPDRPAAEFIAELLDADVPEDTLAPQSVQDAVLVCTPSALIGTEFSVVALAAVQENVWPNLRPRGSLLHAQELATDSIGIDTNFAAARASVLDDELRMFALAASRATTAIVMTATASDDMLPSPFVRRVEAVVGKDRTGTAAERNTLTEYPLTLRGMVGALRRALTVSLKKNPDSVRTTQIASALAKLSEQDIPGAHPRSWYGLTQPSTTEPLYDLTQAEVRVPVSPSKLETWEKNQLAWFIESVVGRTSSSAQGIGTIVHKVMEDVGNNPDLPIDPESLWNAVDARWHELSFDAPWLNEAERRRVRKMVGALSEYLQNFNQDEKKLLDNEGGFTLNVGPATVRGYIDRIEQDVQGHVVIVDLKTGKNFPASKDVPEHAQLACYQLALSSDALENVPQGAFNGGAKLIYLTNGVKGKLYREIVQEPYDEQAIAHIRERIESAAQGMAGTTFEAPVVIKEALGDPHSRYEFRIHTVSAVSSS
jgi:superfamily I DNA/RNA helicase/RecB family exonuclease